MENIALLVSKVKIICNITWDDDFINEKIYDIIEDAEITLNHKLGAEIDYSQSGIERRLFLNYCLYAWNDCLDEFDKKYMNEIYQIRAIHEVKQYVKKKDESVQ